MSNRDLRRHEKSDGVKWVFTGIAIFLIVVLLAGVCMQVFAKDDKFKPSTWFEKKQEEQLPDEGGEEPKAPVDEAGNELKTDGSVYALPSRLTFRSSAKSVETTSESANTVRLTAVTEPTFATNQKGDVTAAFKNASSTWATGKTVTDYITITPTSEGSLVFDVECKAAFGESIILTVTSRDTTNGTITATCQLDYLRRIHTLTAGNSFRFSQTTASSINVTCFLDVGTVQGDLTFGTIAYSVSDSFVSKLEANSYYKTAKQKDSKISIKKTGTLTMARGNLVSGIPGGVSGGVNLAYPVSGKVLTDTTFFLTNTSVSSAAKSDFNNAVVQVMQAGGYGNVMTVQVYSTYGYGTRTENRTISTEVSSIFINEIQVSVNGLTLNNSEVLL